MNLVCFESNEQIQPNDNELKGAYAEEHVGSSTSHVNPEQVTEQKDASSLVEAHLPITVSLTRNSESFALNISKILQVVYLTQSVS